MVKQLSGKGILTEKKFCLRFSSFVQHSIKWIDYSAVFMERTKLNNVMLHKYTQGFYLSLFLFDKNPMLSRE